MRTPASRGTCGFGGDTSEDEHAFLATVLATIRDRDVEFKARQAFYRAQLGVEVVDRTDDAGNWIGEDTWGYGVARMKPLIDRAREGRANPTGIPALYLATSPETAVSEVRPWIGADVSVALCRLLRPLRTLDLTRGHGQSSFAGPVLGHLMGGRELTSEEKEKAVWIDIDNAFSEPVTGSDDRADYAPTQILAELFRSAGATRSDTATSLARITIKAATTAQSSIRMRLRSSAAPPGG